MLSKTCEYGLRAMIFIAQHSRDGKRIGIKIREEIATMLEGARIGEFTEKLDEGILFLKRN